MTHLSKVEIERMPLLSQARLYRLVEAALFAARREIFKEKAVVSIGSDVVQHRFFGIVMRDGDCPADKIPCLLENGNIWWYPVEGVALVSGGPKYWPRWVKTVRLRWMRAATEAKAQAVNQKIF